MEIEQQIRAFDPFPGVTSSLQGAPLKLWGARVEEGSGEPGTILQVGAEGLKVACGQGVLVVTVAQKPGGRRLPLGELLRGFSVAPGARFDPPAAPGH